ncbi:MAG: hypothetical protein COA58_09655 [Bacteroidetes bacterium]|nr:MAG: hypothetical protein COA58_09655 [Bacteroidota bacterium]
MKHFLTLLLAIAITGSISAQIVEVNPNIGWKFIRSQKLDLQTESVYQYEFPAEKGYDYIFNLFFNKPDIITYINIFDMQMKPIANMKDSLGIKTSKLDFVVPMSGTYIVSMGYKNRIVSTEPNTSIEMVLIRRPIVE